MARMGITPKYYVDALFHKCEKLAKERKVKLHVTVDESVLKAIDEERGPLIKRSTMADHLLKKGILAIRSERAEQAAERGTGIDVSIPQK